MKRLLFTVLLALCLIISIGAKETEIYKNEFNSASDLVDDNLYMKGNMVVTNGKLQAKKLTGGVSAYLAYTLPEEYQGMPYIAEFDITGRSTLSGFVIGATGEDITSDIASYFSGYSFCITESGERLYYGAFNGNNIRGFSNSRIVVNDIPDLHFKVKVQYGTMTASVYKLGETAPLYVSRYEMGAANQNDSGAVNDMFEEFTSTIGVRQYYNDGGYIDNFTVSIIEDDVLPEMSSSVTLGSTAFAAKGITVTSGTATGTGAMLSSADRTGNYRVSFDLAANDVSRLYFGMSDKENGYAFEVNEAESALFLYKIINGAFIPLAEDEDVIRAEDTTVTLDVHSGIVSIYYDNFEQDGSEFPKFEFYLDNTDGKIGFWLEGGSVKNLEVGESTVTLPEETYLNPVNTGADPDVLYYNGTYYLYVYSGVRDDNIFRVYTSPDLVHFTPRNIVFKWQKEYSEVAMRDSAWSPNVSYYDGLFYLFFAAKRVEENGENIRSVYYATSTSPYGPFEFKDADGNYKPLEPVNPLEQQKLDGYTGEREYNEDGTPVTIKSNEIDGHPFYDDVDRDGDGKNDIYMSFSRYDSGGTIWVVQVTMEDGKVTPVVDENGEIVQERAIVPTLEWETDGATHLCEGGYIWKHEGLYYMIYATTSYARHYGEAYAVADNPLGPWTKYEHGKFLTHNFELNGPGDALIVPSPDQSELYLVYHRHFSTEKVHQRQTCVDQLVFVDDPSGGNDIITTAGPSSTPQKLPSNIYRYDVDRSGTVGLSDILKVIENMNTTVEDYCGYYDADADGRVSLRDVMAVLVEACK